MIFPGRLRCRRRPAPRRCHARHGMLPARTAVTRGMPVRRSATVTQAATASYPSGGICIAGDLSGPANRAPAQPADREPGMAQLPRTAGRGVPWGERCTCSPLAGSVVPLVEVLGIPVLRDGDAGHTAPNNPGTSFVRPSAAIRADLCPLARANAQVFAPQPPSNGQLRRVSTGRPIRSSRTMSSSRRRCLSSALASTAG